MDPAPLVLAGTFAPKLSARLKDLGGDAPGGVTAAFPSPLPRGSTLGQSEFGSPAQRRPRPRSRQDRHGRIRTDGLCVRRSGSVRAEPAALPALGQAHPQMGPRDDGAGGADPSKNAAGLAPRCRARSEERGLAVLKGGERAALPAPPAQRAWSKVTHHAQRHNKGRSPSHSPRRIPGPMPRRSPPLRCSPGTLGPTCVPCRQQRPAVSPCPRTALRCPHVPRTAPRVPVPP